MDIKLKNAVELFRFFYLEQAGNVDCTDLTLSEVKEHIASLMSDEYKEFSEITSDDDGSLINIYQAFKDGMTDADLLVSVDILDTCLDATNSSYSDLEAYEFFDLVLEIQEKRSTEEDFWIDSLPCGEVRCINENEIDEIWTDSLIEQIKKCYDLSDLPDFISIDWSVTAENCKADGMGHHFASYDHEDHYSNGLHIFRTN